MKRDDGDTYQTTAMKIMESPQAEAWVAGRALYDAI